jgi:hypothetical protein
MSKVITFSTRFPSYHPKAWQPTHFVEKFWNSFNVETLGQTFLADFDYEVTHKLNKSIPYSSICHFNAQLHKSNRENLGAKYHTIRSGNRWKVGDKFSPRVWGNDVNPKSGRSGPYHSKQIVIAPDIEVKKVWDIEIKEDPFTISFELLNNMLLKIDGHYATPEIIIPLIAKNDGLDLQDLLDWFKYPKPFVGQIISWSNQIEY